MIESHVYLYDDIVKRELEPEVEVYADMDRPDPSVGYLGSIQITDVLIITPFWWMGKLFSGDLLEHEKELKPYMFDDWLEQLEEEYIEGHVT